MLTILRHIIQEVTSAQSFSDALEIMVKRIANALATQACSIFLLDRHHGEYVLVATQGLNPKAVNKIRVPINKGLIGLVGEREEPINIDDATKHPRFLHVAEAGEEAYRAFLGTPVIYHRQVLGVLIVQQEEPRRYDESEEAFLVTLATQLAAIIAHAEATGALAELMENSKGKRHDLVYSGVPGAPGIGMGTGVVIYPPYDLDSVPDREPDNIEAEIELLDAAFATVREDLRQLSERLYPTLPSEERALFDVYQRILDSADLGKEVADNIRAGNWAQGALRQSIQTHVRRLESLDNEYMRERAVDIKDLGLRVLACLQKNNRITPQYSEKTILIGEALAPTDLAEVPEGCLAGVVSASGSGNSHVAILARAMKVPTVMGVGEAQIHDLQGKEIIVDGYYGQVHVSPGLSLRTEFERLIQEEKKLDAELDEIRDLPAVTKDGQRIGLLVNTGLGADISISLAAGAEGVGLYRTEIPFLMRDRFPSGEEQRIIYRQLLASFAPRPVILRTLDVGGDKPLPYFPIKEDNPFLGWRGIRITLDHPEIFLSQIRAMMRASEGLNNMRVMLPMITDVTEVDEALRLLKKAYAEVRDEGYDIEMPQIGVMIEVPSAVYQARALAKRVDFLSVGSNDLTQYLLAVDRNNPRVANLYDALHPAVLRALIQIVESGHQEGKHISICGELAGDPVAVMLLIAIGFDSLSMNASSVGRIRWVIRHVTKKKSAKLLHEVLSMESAVMIRCHMELALERAGLGNLIRAGR
ncbi:Phosphoenolpyruvate-protein phosphotransferase [Aquicella siphonis]|uniref:phosphoenolpyruvate--protein phosphotransferase n=1 Tax=Aquicella siphonis TaxID=254247 RepID=A0A5E4PI37_9COXI|nr:phosphoenolpyruvate--protein phosphotransferase [Aquicella siphonis]VVC76710.1 Phosphoenolpyruvate-protein phosphotransferase [Aquicella siphonis]